MSRSWWLPVVAAAVVVLVPGVAAAQTVYVRSAPAAAPIEIVMNATALGSATADATGDARLVVDVLKGGGTETSAHIYLDVCDKTRRIGLIGRSQIPPPPEPGCDRKEVPGYFVLRRTTTLVINIGGELTPTVLSRQGRPPAEWLAAGHIIGAAPEPVTRGLVVWGSSGIARFERVFDRTCGNASYCTGSEFRPDIRGGVDYWIARRIAVEASYLRSSKPFVRGNDKDFTFDSALDPDIFTIGGKYAAIRGPIRIYVTGGFNYHRATYSTTQTVDDTIRKVSGVAVTFPGGTETFPVQTHGWGWLVGGGVEGWIRPRVAFYAELGWLALKGGDANGGDASLDDRVMFPMMGFKYRVPSMSSRRPAGLRSTGATE